MKQPKYNGKPGVVKQYDASAARYHVVLEAEGGVYRNDNDTLNIKRENLHATGWASAKTRADLGLSA